MILGCDLAVIVVHIWIIGVDNIGLEMRRQNAQTLFIRKFPTYGLEFVTYKVRTTKPINFQDDLLVKANFIRYA